MRRILASIVLVMMMAGCDSENASDTEKPSEAQTSSEPKVLSKAAKTFEEGTAAFDRGDYPAALEIWRPLAEQGLAPAQINLGNAYLRGNGVFPDDVKAAKWFRRAAEQGDPKAQNNLGVMYANGKGVPQSFVQAYVWFSLGATKALVSNQPGDPNDAAANRDRAASQMTPAQIAEGQRLAREWKPE